MASLISGKMAGMSLISLSLLWYESFKVDFLLSSASGAMFSFSMQGCKAIIY